eukprot:TRINITY_DN10507_c2_g1_i1.p2 TRINITY_DN10507_c2_g1~~TRINITY_DN10507_c2_g1_i1.p2  ORF type:complete len:143 (-),score=33.27 TRINITY_DN10507_c2_g1_i1:75-503(-)
MASAVEDTETERTLSLSSESSSISTSKDDDDTATKTETDALTPTSSSTTSSSPPAPSPSSPPPSSSSSSSPSSLPNSTILYSTPPKKATVRPPIWINDADVPRCPSCCRKFGPLRRRHHCRHCGRIFCEECSIWRTGIWHKV